MKRRLLIIGFLTVTLLGFMGIKGCEDLPLPFPTPTNTPEPTPTITPTPEPTPTITPTIEPSPTVEPTVSIGTCVDIRDGAGGRLWKPVSDNTGKPVVLMPPDYCNGAVPIGINTDQVGDGVIRKKCSEANERRAHWYLDLDRSKYKKNLKITFDGRPECFIVTEPTQRQD